MKKSSSKVSSRAGAAASLAAVMTALRCVDSSDVIFAHKPRVVKKLPSWEGPGVGRIVGLLLTHP
jgi:hypothetical protein